MFVPMSFLDIEREQTMREVTAKMRRIFKDPEKRRAWIHYQLKIQGDTYVSLGKRREIPSYCFQRCLAHPYPKIEKVLADEMGLTPQILFPERYDADGLPNRKMGRPRKKQCYQRNKSNNADTRNMQREEAI
jgi:Ner family transcriptional regulator